MTTPPARTGSSRSSFAKTILISVCSTVLILGYLWVTTAASVPSAEKIDRWKDSARLEPYQGGWGATVQPEATLLHHPVRATASRFSELTFDLFIEKPMRPQVLVGFVPPGQPDLLLWVPLPSSQIRRTGWNRIVVPFDMHEGFFGTELISLSLSSPQGPNLIAVRGARLVVHSYSDRLEGVLSALFQQHPLSQGSNNFIESPVIAGRSVPLVFWLALLLALALLAVRRFVLHETLDIIPNAVTTLVVLIVLAGLLRIPNAYRDLADAAAIRLESTDLASHVGNHEQRSHGFAWFGPALRDLQGSTADSTRIFVNSKYVAGLSEAMARLVYYAHPARRAGTLQQANLALCYGPPSGQLARSKDWEQTRTLPGGIDVYRHRR